LSIRRNDRGVVSDWRDVQLIKNELAGPECEGVQLFPAESRLVDTANQYYIYCILDPSVRFPFGFEERLVAEGSTGGSVQRPFEPGTRPDDCKDADHMDAAIAAFKDHHGPKYHTHAPSTE